MANDAQIPITSAEWSVEGLPTGLSFTNGVLTGTPTAANGRYTPKISVQTPWGIASKVIPITIRDAWQFGFKIKKNEPDPYERVEYLFDAKGMTPAHMDFTNGVFDYGSWADVDFIKNNKPLMLKSNGIVDYYLDPNDYTKKLDGTSSDVANTNYGGNAMAQFPLLWIYRYEDDEYEYEIISNQQIDQNYKAYAHTRADGSIADYFYWSMFGGSGNSSKIRSLSGQSLAQNLTAQQEITGCQANGEMWYTHTWSQREFIRTLLILLGKSTNTQAVFGTGNCRSSGSVSTLLSTGTLNDKGQFYGFSSNSQQIKVFHIEKFWGDQWDRTAGVIYKDGRLYVKMTPEGEGYQIDTVNGYTNTGISIQGSSGSYINRVSCGDYGILPTHVSGADSTFYCDGSWFNNSGLYYLVSGASAVDASGIGGCFTFDVDAAPSNSYWNVGCGLSCTQPAAA